MKWLLGLALAGGLWLGMTSAAEAQFSLSIGNPYGFYGGGYPYGGVYGAPVGGVGVLPGATVYSSGYAGVLPGITTYRSGYYGVYPGVGVAAYGYPYRPYGYGFRPFGYRPYGGWRRVGGFW
jgi:hypothetical protein